MKVSKKTMKDVIEVQKLLKQEKCPICGSVLQSYNQELQKFETINVCECGYVRDEGQ